MTTILVLDSAATGEASVSKALVREAVAALTDGTAPASSTATSATIRCRT